MYHDNSSDMEKSVPSTPPPKTTSTKQMMDPRITSWYLFGKNYALTGGIIYIIGTLQIWIILGIDISQGWNIFLGLNRGWVSLLFIFELVFCLIMIDAAGVLAFIAMSYSDIDNSKEILVLLKGSLCIGIIIFFIALPFMILGREGALCLGGFYWALILPGIIMIARAIRTVGKGPCVVRY